MNNILFYDIESLQRLFSLAAYYKEKEKTCVDVYYLYDPDGTGCVHLSPESDAYLRYMIFRENPNLDPDARINFYNLLDENANLRLAKSFGCVAPGLTVEMPLVRDVDPEYDPALHPFLAGYNILNYDMTQLAFYFSEVFAKSGDKTFSPTTPEIMREYNDELFDPFFKSQMPRRLRYRYHGNPAKAKYDRDAVRIGGRYLVDEGWNSQAPAKLAYDYMAASGRHLDVARLNEKQFRVGLKRLLGMLGRQIKEPVISLGSSGKSGILDFERFADIVAYNCSDVIQLSALMDHRAYNGPFRLKSQMLKDYPGAIYRPKKNEKGEDLYEPNIRPEAVRRDRLTVNASSAKLAAAALCPYGELGDNSYVTFSYPHPEMAKKRGITPFNVLDFMDSFIRTRMEPLVKSQAGQSIIDGAREALAMYRDIEHRDFNATHDDGFGTEISDLRNFRKVVNVPYMGPDGEPTSCFVTFSVGGIHGCEYDKARYEQDLRDYQERRAFFARLQNAWPDPLQLLTDYKPNGRPCRRKTFWFEGLEYEVKDFLKSSSTMKKAEWKMEWLEPRKPELFRKSSNSENRKLDPRYGYTSFGEMNHEDFTSYYPRMLSQMMAFYNAQLGRDPYEEIFQNKGKFGKMMKDKSYSESERDLYATMRNGTKLILNSASGAADTDYRTSIRMNNRITQMRIMGQIFAWVIGQAQALQGALVPSTNTDGLYTVMEEAKNNEILFREAAVTGVEIEPERMFVISKDTNNRIEAKITGCSGDIFKDVSILGASGGTLACRRGPDPEKALDHPAIQDWALSWFLIHKAIDTGEIGQWEPDTGLDYLKNKAKEAFPDRVEFLRMFQNIVASSPGTHAYTFGSKEPILDPKSQDIKPVPMQHYTRVFYVDLKKLPPHVWPRVMYLAQAYVMKRGEAGDATGSLPAITVIKDMNGDEDALLAGIPKIKKIKGIEQTQPCIVANEDLKFSDIDPKWLDYDYYAKQLGECYKNAWQNGASKEISEGADNNPDEN